MDFNVDLDIFRGPLDLLLYLVRKHEVDVVEVSIARVTDQFLAHMAALEPLDVTAAGEFLEVASTLIEIKSRQVLPHGDEVDDQPDLAQQELVRRLLEYKRFRDAASLLEERSRTWEDRFPRLVNDLPRRPRKLAEEPIREVELWDLVSAFGRLARDSGAGQASSIVYDDTPITVFMTDINDRLGREGRLALTQLFVTGMHKSARVGVFLALLELVRHRQVCAEQDRLFSEIWILPGPRFGQPLEIAAIDQYDHGVAG